MITIRTWALSGSGAGCYYSTSHGVAVYSRTYRPVVPVQIRYYQDSFISADELTRGCSSSSPGSSSCFGMSRKEQNVTGSILSLIGGVLTLIEIFAVIAMCMCCRDGPKKNRFKKSVGSKGTIPITCVPSAQPVYPSQPQVLQADVLPQPGYVQGSMIPQPAVVNPYYVPQSKSAQHGYTSSTQSIPLIPPVMSL